MGERSRLAEADARACATHKDEADAVFWIVGRRGDGLHLERDLTNDDIAALLAGCGVSDKASAMYILSCAQLKDNV
jgi:hypothetical protein